MSDTNALTAQLSRNSLLDKIANPAVVNPVAAISDAAKTASAIYGVRSQQANQAWGNALQQATDPQTGVVDYQKAQSIAAQDPQAAMGMATNLQNTSNIRSQQISQGVARNTAVNNAIIGALSGDDAGLHDRVVNGFNGLVANGVMTQDEATRSALRLPADPTQLRQQLQQIQTSLAPPDLQQQQIYGKPFTQTAPGGATIGGTTNIRTGVPTAPPQPGVQQGMTPAEAAQPVTWTDKNNVPQHTTLQEYGAAFNSGNARGPAYDANGRPVQGTGVGGPGGSSTAPQPPVSGAPPLPTGYKARPVAGQPPAAGDNTASVPATAPPAATSGAPQPRSISGPAPGVGAAADETAKASATMGTTLTARADQVPTNKANYANMLTDLSKIDSMGPGTDKEIAINSAVQKLTGYGITMTPQQIAAGNSFAKLANIAVGQQLQAIGGTDARQALFMGSNPNLDLSKLSNTQIIHMLQGNEDAIQAKSRAWQSWQQSGHGTDTYAQFQNDFNHHFDPRVFQQQYMAPSEIADLRKSLTGQPGGTQKFLDDVKYARDNHWIQ
ncbi:MAG TPA: hypothetical protein VGH84_05235 [Steroidobacteraceae bacterium]